LASQSCKAYKSLLSPCGIQNDDEISRKYRLQHTPKEQWRNFMRKTTTRCPTLCTIVQCFLVLTGYVLEGAPVTLF